MSRIPPSLLYLTIYNPTLKPAFLEPDNEDAEEQAHILFYTAREHAVSRDRILRQVGLAKALVNFSEMFNAGIPCENVHSQGRRMVMISPEPNFWIHACYEVAKTPRPHHNSKGKGTPKAKSKDKEKETDQTSRPTTIYDYLDGSIHDIALRTHFQRGYEEFKLLHGSFDSILSNVGQQALELQLERFFTVWAWKWDIEDDDFGTHLGIPLHPSHAKLTPLLDKFASSLPDELMTFALSPPHIIPSRTPRYPAALIRHVLARIPPPVTPVPKAKQTIPSSTVTAPPLAAQMGKQTTSADVKSPPPQTESGFAFPLPPMPAMPNMTFGLDVKSMKWGWPGYLTFGKGGGTPAGPSGLSSLTAAPPNLEAVIEGQNDLPKAASTDHSPRPESHRKNTLDVDTASLLEAISTESIGSYSRTPSPAPSVLSKSSQLGELSTETSVSTGGNVSPVDDADPLEIQVNGIPQIVFAQPAPELPPLQITARPVRSFLWSRVHLDSPDDPSITERCRVLHLTHHEFTVAIVAKEDHSLDLPHLVDEVVEVIETMQASLTEESQEGESSLPSAVKILQPKDRQIVSKDEFTYSPSPGFVSRSEHLYNGQELLRSGLDVYEVFSRGQNPQHWHIGKRGLGATADGEVYMEVGRKETTLTDVDNELAGVVYHMDLWELYQTLG